MIMTNDFLIGENRHTPKMISVGKCIPDLRNAKNPNELKDMAINGPFKVQLKEL